MKKLCVYIIFIFINTELNAELLKASPLLDPKQVIQIQLNALKKNNEPYKDYGIEQTYEFAHPLNRVFTGPLENFTKMMYSNNYIKILNHKRHIINTIEILDKSAFFYIEIIDINGQNLGFKWTVEKVFIEGQFLNCWMTTSVSTPMKYGESA